ncbi:MAG: diguanylate cyclase [Spirochaetes bacterium]|jgi:diguanylate cyclase (GGDEF)-like protein|nr:diguanylate cyclase [Spirochaetota bacterium]
MRSHDDDIMRWAERVAADAESRDNDLLEDFVRLKNAYARLVRHFNQVTRMSDSYQQTLKELNESLDAAARQDPLTRLPNRRRMIEHLDAQVERAARYNETFSVVLCDLDRFKNINDTYGHQAGDRVLVLVADALSELLRKGDVCARWGGEEFLLCLPHTAVDGARSVAEKVRAGIETLSIPAGDDEVRPTVSVGISEYTAGATLDDTISQADTAMYAAKHLGRNAVYVFGSTDDGS